MLSSVAEKTRSVLQRIAELEQAEMEGGGSSVEFDTAKPLSFDADFGVGVMPPGLTDSQDADSQDAEDMEQHLQGLLDMLPEDEREAVRTARSELFLLLFCCHAEDELRLDGS